MKLKINDFPVTRYQGSKRKIVLWIHEALKENDINFNNVLDVFGGTGSVSYLFKKLGKSVTYNDYLKFNHTIGKALIENNSFLIGDDEIEIILQANSVQKKISQTFRGIYYHDHENIWLDNIIEGIEATFRNKRGAEYKRAVAYYALFQACLIKRPFNLFHRNNLSIRVNDVERNFGNKTTWERPFDELFVKFINEANHFVFKGEQDCFSLNKSAFKIDPYGFDMVYLDPPYFARKGNHETSNYHRCYHFLEGIANYKNWEQFIDYSTPNLRMQPSYAPNAFNKENIYESVDFMIDKFRNSVMVFSYKKGGLPSIDYIVKRMKLVKRNVITKSVHYKYALNHQNGDAKKNREVLIIGL